MTGEPSAETGASVPPDGVGATAWGAALREGLVLGEVVTVAAWVGDGLGVGVTVGAGEAVGVGGGVGADVAGGEVGRRVGAGVDGAVGAGVGTAVGAGVAAAVTTIVPFICESAWTMQKYGNVPCSVNVRTYSSPTRRVPELKRPSGCPTLEASIVPDVTVCGSPSIVQTTVSPTAIVRLSGAKT